MSACAHYFYPPITCLHCVYDVVSDISHSGKLLRAEMGDMGFNKVRKDEQTLFEIDVPRITRLAMVNWLKTGQCEDTGD